MRISNDLTSSRQTFLQAGLLLKSPIFLNSNHPMAYECKDCHWQGHKNLEKIKRSLLAGRSGCSKCSRKGAGQKRRNKIKDITIEFAKRHLVIKQPFNYQCDTQSIPL